MGNPSVNLFSILNGRDGFFILGKFSSLDPVFGTEEFGFSVSPLGDVNGDGIDDLIIGARQSTVGSISGAGKSFVIFGQSGIGGNGSFDLSSLNGSNGFVINGAVDGERSGHVVSGIGDFNNDGNADLAIGSFALNQFEFRGSPTAPEESLTSLGRAYVVYGKNGGFGTSFDLAEVTAEREYEPDLLATVNTNYSNGFSVRSLFGGSFQDSEHLAGFDVNPVGDIDRDGFDDFILGAPGPGLGRASSLPGEAWIVYGQNRTPVGSTLNDQNRDFSQNLRIARIRGIPLEGTVLQNRTGNAVSGADDINGDGTPDVVIAARHTSDRAGEVFVVFGGDHIIPEFAPSSTKKIFNLSELGDTTGFRIFGTEPNDFLGWDVSQIGDFNGDDLTDVILGAPGRSASGTDSTSRGKSYVIFGKTGTSRPDVNLASLSIEDGFVITGKNSGDASGFAVGSAGDINQDGYDDLIIGAPFADPDGFNNAGEAYVIFGSRDSVIRDRFRTGFNLSALDGKNGFALKGTFSNDQAGWSLNTAGDINNDGVDDLILGALGGDSLPGKSYIVFGNAAPVLDLNGLPNAGVDNQITYTSGGSPVALINDRPSSFLSLFDRNDTTLQKATVKITNPLNGTSERLTANTSGTSLFATYDSNNGTLDLVGIDTIANYHKVLRSLTYQNTAPSPNRTQRIIEFVVSDGKAHSNESEVARTFLTIVPPTSGGTGGGTGSGTGGSSGSVPPPAPIIPPAPVPPLASIIPPAPIQHIGTNRRDVITGGLGNDTLIGKGGNDVISGDAGDDLLLAGIGNDRIKPGQGNNRIKPGQGNDRIILDINEPFDPVLIGANTLLGFEPGKDRIILDRSTFTRITRNISFDSVRNLRQSQTSNALITYARSSRGLYYNENRQGAGFGEGGLFATFNRPVTLATSDFTTQA